MADSSLKRSILLGGFWSVVGQFSSLFITLIANIWLARLLSPKEFGQMGIIIFFVSIANVLTESGLSGALIRNPNSTKEDYSTVFIFNFCVSVLCFFILLLISSYVADFYNDESIRKPLIIAGLILIINAFSFIQNTRLVANLQYKKKSTYDIISVIISSFIGVFLAYLGYGLWALVILQIIRYGIYTSLLWSVEKFRIPLVFRKEFFLRMYSFGLYTTLSSVLNIAFNNIYQLILGKVASIPEVGLYYQAKKIDDVPTGLLTNFSQGVVFSGLSKIQDDKVHYAATYKKIITNLLFVYGLVLVLVFFYAEIIIAVLLGDKWIGAAFYLRFLCAASYFYVQETFNRVIFKTYNQTHKIFYLELIKKGIQIISILIGLYFKDITVLLIGYIVTNAIGYVINFISSRRIINDSKFSEFVITFKVLFAMIISVISGFGIEYLFNLHGWISLILILVIVPLYAIILKLMNVLDLLTLFRDVTGKRLIKYEK